MSDGEEWGPWHLHDDAGWPASVRAGVIVQVRFKHDGHVTWPMVAEELDWHCPGDPIAAFRIRKARGLTILESLIADLPAPVAPKVTA